MINKISHIGIAVRSLDEALKLYEETFGLKSVHTETIKERKVKVAFLPIGKSKIELLESLNEEGPIGKFIAARGEGVHHIAFQTDDMKTDLYEAKKKGLRLIDEKPRQGAHGAKVAFIHPKSTKGVLIELCEENVE